MSFFIALKNISLIVGVFALLMLPMGCSGGGGDDGEANNNPGTTESDGGGVDSSDNDQSIDETDESGEGKTTVLTCGSPNGGIVDGALNDEAKEYLLCLHNQTRSVTALGDFAGLYGDFDIATDMKRLFWDEKLEQVAQGWVNQCEWMHNPDRSAQYNALSPSDIHGDPINGGATIGENLAYKGWSNQSELSFQFAIDGYLAWEDEGHFYSIGDFNVSDFCDTTACGHFTQLIWADTFKVGCAVNLCPSETLANIPTTYLACNYASAGNYISQRPYQTGMLVNEVCSDADAGQSVCKNGLTQANDYTKGL